MSYRKELIQAVSRKLFQISRRQSLGQIIHTLNLHEVFSLNPHFCILVSTQDKLAPIIIYKNYVTLTKHMLGYNPTPMPQQVKQAVDELFDSLYAEGIDEDLLILDCML